jgi:hypothetical protein
MLCLIFGNSQKYNSLNIHDYQAHIVQFFDFCFGLPFLSVKLFIISMLIQYINCPGRHFAKLFESFFTSNHPYLCSVQGGIGDVSKVGQAFYSLYAVLCLNNFFGSQSAIKNSFKFLNFQIRSFNSIAAIFHLFFYRFHIAGNGAVGITLFSFKFLYDLLGRNIFVVSHEFRNFIYPLFHFVSISHWKAIKQVGNWLQML